MAALDEDATRLHHEEAPVIIAAGDRPVGPPAQEGKAPETHKKGGRLGLWAAGPGWPHIAKHTVNAKQPKTKNK